MSQKKEVARERRKKRIHKKIRGTSERPRLVVFKSLKHIYVQLIDDGTGNVLSGSSSLSKDFSASGGNVAGAKTLGETMGKKIKEQGVSKIVFDRNGYPYHGRVKALAEALREGGLDF